MNPFFVKKKKFKLNLNKLCEGREAERPGATETKRRRTEEESAPSSTSEEFIVVEDSGSLEGECIVFKESIEEKRFEGSDVEDVDPDLLDIIYRVRSGEIKTLKSPKKKKTKVLITVKDRFFKEKLPKIFKTSSLVSLETPFGEMYDHVLSVWAQFVVKNNLYSLKSVAFQFDSFVLVYDDLIVSRYSTPEILKIDGEAEFYWMLKEDFDRFEQARRKEFSETEKMAFMKVPEQAIDLPLESFNDEISLTLKSKDFSVQFTVFTNLLISDLIKRLGKERGIEKDRICLYFDGDLQSASKRLSEFEDEDMIEVKIRQ